MATILLILIPLILIGLLLTPLHFIFQIRFQEGLKGSAQIRWLPLNLQFEPRQGINIKLGDRFTLYRKRIHRVLARKKRDFWPGIKKFTPLVRKPRPVDGAGPSFLTRFTVEIPFYRGWVLNLIKDGLRYGYLERSKFSGRLEFADPMVTGILFGLSQCLSSALGGMSLLVLPRFEADVTILGLGGGFHLSWFYILYIGLRNLSIKSLRLLKKLFS